MSKKDKKQTRHYLNQNPLESLMNIGQAAGDSIVKDLAAPAVTDFWEQFLGVEVSKQEKHAGELHEGEELDLKKHKSEAEAGEVAEEYIREVIHPEKASSHENQEIQVRVEQILVEIKKLSESSKELEVQFKEAAVEIPVENVGKYHENFLEWLFATISAARARIEESSGWLSAMHSKKDRKYWAMFKKHGTSFGLSNERSVATQVG